MSTREIASPIQGGAIDAAYNLSNTLLAVQQAGQILVLARQRPQIEFSPLASLPLEESDKEITCLAWAPPDQGAVLAAGTADGAILLWTGRAAPGSAACAPPASWSQPQRLPAGRRRVNQLAFEPSPVSAGVRALAAACEDGFVRCVGLGGWVCVHRLAKIHERLGTAQGSKTNAGCTRAMPGTRRPDRGSTPARCASPASTARPAR